MAPMEKKRKGAPVWLCGLSTVVWSAMALWQIHEIEVGRRALALGVCPPEYVVRQKVLLALYTLVAVLSLGEWVWTMVLRRREGRRAGQAQDGQKGSY